MMKWGIIFSIIKLECGYENYLDPYVEYLIRLINPKRATWI